MGMLGSVNTGGFSEASKAAMMNSDYFNRPTGISRFAGGFADFLTGNRFDLDKRGKNDEEKKGSFDNLLEGYSSYRPDKRSDTGQLLSMAGQRAGGLGMGGGRSFMVGDNVTFMSPDNTARQMALLEKQRLDAQRAAEAKQKRRMAGAAIGGALFGPVGGIIGGLFCDIRLKEDIAPLCKSEVNDVLSECAFFVKDLNECS